MENQVKFTQTVIVQKILDQNEDLRKLKLLNCKVDQSNQIDGFIGNIIFMTLEFKEGERKFVVKLMKPPSPLRAKLGGDTMFKNELFIYSDVIPTFLSKFQQKFKIIDQHLYSPRIYLAESGIYPELSAEKETLLVMENLTPKGYRLGNRLTLSEKELRLMCKAIAQYHACSYTMRITGDPALNKLRSGLTPIPFTKEDDSSEKSMGDVAYEIAMERLLKYFDASPEELDSPEFKENIKNLRKKYENKPSHLMQRFLRDDEKFSVILHGDYNRNNVLFKYENNEAIDLRFIDFQEVRYGTPAIDVSFFLFMNMDPKAMESGLLMDLVKFYHKCLLDAIAELLGVAINDAKLNDYRWEPFFNHFKQFGLYGAMVSVLFIPWMACPEDECAKLQELFEKDVHSKEFHDFSLIAGGKPVDERITRIIRHASKCGFMEMVSKDD